MLRRVFYALTLSLCLASAAQAAALLTVGVHDLQPNKAGQIVDIFVVNDSLQNVAGVNFGVLVADGGPLNVLTGPGVIVGPSVTADIISVVGMLFQVNNTGQGDQSGGFFGPQGTAPTTTTTSGTIPMAVGKIFLGRLTFDTTGFNSGSWDLNMGGSNNQTSAYLSDFSGTSILLASTAGIPMEILDGTIRIVPEPSTIVMGLFAFVGLGAVAVMRRRK